MKLYITDHKKIAENLAETLKAMFNTKKGYYENKEDIVLYIEPSYTITLSGVGRKLIKFFDGMEEITPLVNYAEYRDILKLKKIIEEFNPEIINICNPSSKGQMNFEIICLCAGIDSKNAKRVWLRSNIISTEALLNIDSNKNYYSIYEAALCDSIIDLYWSLRNADLFGEELSKYSLNMKEMFLLDMIALKEAQIQGDDTVGAEYFRIEVSIRDKVFKWSNKKKEDRVSTVEEAREIVKSLPDKQMLITKADIRATEKEHPLLYNSTDLYKDVQKNKIATIKELKAILNKLYSHGYITNPNTESRHLPMSFVTVDSVSETNKLTDILIAIKGIPHYKPYIEYIKKINESVSLSTRALNDKHVDNHHAIVPTTIAPVAHNLTPQEYSVYDLIVRRFLTLFLGNQVENTLVVNGYIDANNQLKHEETKVIKPGWQIVYQTEEDIYDLLNAPAASAIKVSFSVGEYIPIDKQSIIIQAGNSRGKSRYTIPTLIDLMGNCGKTIKDDNKKVRLRHLSIGLPGERNIIINDLLDKLLIEVIDDKVHLTHKGKEIIDKAPKGLLSTQLLETFNSKIKAIEQGHDTLYSVLREHTSYITKIIFNKKTDTNPYKMVDYTEIVKNNKCPFCQGNLADKGDFIGCRNYPACGMSIPKEKNQYILTENDIRQLLENGITKQITGFTFRKGTVRGGKAKLKFNLQRKVEFEFDEQNKKDSDQ